MITIRKSTITDLDEVTKIFDKYRQSYGETSNLIASRQFIKERLSNNESIIFIAEENNNTVGFTQLYPIFSSVSLSRVFILNDLYVNETYRRRGIGKDLLLKAEEFASYNNASRVTLNVLRKNKIGQSLYNSSGWDRDEQFYMFHRFL